MGSEQWLRRYRLCLRFASFYNSDHRYDIVHDGYLYYLDKEKEDLFEIELINENSYLYTVIKKAFYRWNYKERTGEKYIYWPTDDLNSKFDAPDEQLIGKDLYEIFYNKLYLATEPNEHRHLRDRKLPLEIFRLKAEGYTQTEIAEQLHISKQLVNQYNKKIEEMNMVNNPFNGSKTVIKKQISEKTWNDRKDHNEFDLEDESEYVQLWIHKESKEGWLVKINKPIGSEFYIKRLEDNGVIGKNKK